MRISDWSSDVCSSDLRRGRRTAALDQTHVGSRGTYGDRPASQSQTPQARLRVPTSVSAACLLPRSSRSPAYQRRGWGIPRRDRKRVVEGKSVSVRLVLGGWRIIKTKNNNTNQN